MKTRILLTLISGLLVTFAAGTAMAQECESDSDCDDGYECELPGFACAEGPNGEGREECEEQRENLTGECVRAPIACEEDADCPGVLTCESWGSDSAVPCTVDEEGNEDCPEPEVVEEESYCGWRPADCDEGTACAEGFECVLDSHSGFAEDDCAEVCDSENNCSSDCGDPEPQEDPAPESGSCYPQEIECDTDAQCPTDWTCYTLAYEECSGGGSTGSEGGSDDAPDTPGGGGEQEGDEDCATFEESRCIPPGFDILIETGGGFGGDGGIAESNGTGDPRDQDLGGQGEESGDDNDGGSSSEDAGCSVSVGAPTSAPVALLALAGLVFLRRRN